MQDGPWAARGLHTSPGGSSWAGSAEVVKDSGGSVVHGVGTLMTGAEEASAEGQPRSRRGMNIPAHLNEASDTLEGVQGVREADGSGYGDGPGKHHPEAHPEVVPYLWPVMGRHGLVFWYDLAISSLSPQGPDWLGSAPEAALALSQESGSLASLVGLLLVLLHRCLWDLHFQDA